MTFAEMARIHRAAFTHARAWSAQEIETLGQPPGFIVSRDGGFAIGRAVAGEAELLTLAVDPAVRRRGLGRALLADFEAGCGAARLFLEVAADNAAAIALYRSAGWGEIGRRPGYYARGQGAVDAVLMSKSRQASPA